jgi:hypothetical protein
MKYWQFLFPLFYATNLFAQEDSDACGFVANKAAAQGWCFDLGGQYTWISSSTPSTYNGSTGGVVGKLSYQQMNSFYGQVRSVYNNSSDDYEWYSEVVGGYTFSRCMRRSITPYVGIGFDFLKETKSSYPGTLHYRIYYALAGVDIHYYWQDWLAGVQAECLPTFTQFLTIGGSPGVAWKLSERVGGAIRVPVAYRLMNKIWLEVAPYYRLLPIGSSSVLSLSDRNLNEWGAFVTFRFFI